MGQQASTSQDKFPFRPIREVQSSPRVPGDFRWSLWDGQDVKDATKSVSIFCLEPSNHPLAQAIFKRFRSFRHPNILPFNHGITVEEEKKTYIVTERVEPLLNKLDELIKLPDAIPWGIHQITVRDTYKRATNTSDYHLKYFIQEIISIEVYKMIFF